jgi:hypothetical protein
MNATISSYPDLQTVLQALPAPKPGTLRVFRGQTQDHPTLTPSGLRRSIRNQVIWLTYSHILYQSLLPKLLRTSQEVTQEMLTAYGLWFHAVAQHYGPGSDFLDVTHSLEVALWFALHECKTLQSAGMIGPPGPLDPQKDHPTAVEMASYVPWNEPGFLYVFDLPKWNGESVAETGTVVDVADAPEIFSSSERMRAQAACLVYCRNKNKNHLDLKTRLVPGTPIKVQRPMTGVTGLDRRVSDLFPSPEQDKWYARLLSVPMGYAPVPAPPRLRRSIPVTVYFDQQNPRYVQEVRFRDWIVSPPLLHRWIQEAAQTVEPSDPIKLVAQAIPIVLEAAMLFPYPPGDSNHWHHGLLVSDVPDWCLTYNFENGQPHNGVSLTNVLFEFSPLEKTDWDRVVRDDAPVSIMRGVWLHRQGDANEFEAGLFYQEIPGDGPNKFVPFRLRYDPSLREFVLLKQPGAPPVPVSQEPALAKEIAKPVFVALMLLRHLSATLKAEASPRAQLNIVEAGQPKSLFIVGCSRDAARLFRVTSPPHSDWFVIRDSAKPEEPFTYPEETDGILELKSNMQFCKMPTDAIHPS